MGPIGFIRLAWYRPGTLAIILIALAVLSCFGIRHWVQKSESRAAWPHVPGKITKNEVYSSVRDFKFRVEYEYLITQQKFVGTAVAAMESQYNSRESAQKAADKYPLGAAVEVYYDPTQPADAYLEVGSMPGAYTASYVIGAMGLCAAGLFAFRRIAALRARAQ